MYQEFFGLRELPFDLSPDPRYLYLTARHSEALANLQYGISARKGLTLLIGEAGTGKTTLVRAALESKACRSARALYLNNPTLTRAEFLEFLADGFGLGSDAAASKAALLKQLERELIARRQRGVITALVIDEAQSLPYELLEEIRLLANIETNTEKLLPLVLAGQPELADRLNEPSLRQLKQRVALRCTLGSLTREETSAYVTGRIRHAGGERAQLFTPEAVDAIYQHSRGVPRTISVICDNALVSGFALQQKPVGVAIVQEVCKDFDFRAVPETRYVPAESTPAFAAPRATPQPDPHHASSEPPAVSVLQPAARSSDPGGDGALFSSFSRRRRFSFF
jgi:type II secretory pathway predicted ATPase ExeA